MKMKKFAQHVFVCTNQDSGVGERVGKDLKSGVKALKLKQALRLSATPATRVQLTGCLGNCDHCKKGKGAAVVVYPEGTWYGNVRPGDVPDLLDEHLRHGRVVDRLVIDGE
jgi:(2Fe-2S) ferredoxin